MLRSSTARLGLAIVISVPLLAGSVSAQSRRPGNNGAYGRGGNGITVFADPNFRGDSATFRNDTSDLRGYRLNDKISSIDIPYGEAWQICQDVNFQNRCVTLNNSVSNLRSIGWGDRISSIRRVRGGNQANSRNGRNRNDRYDQNDRYDPYYGRNRY